MDSQLSMWMAEEDDEDDEDEAEEEDEAEGQPSSSGARHPADRPNEWPLPFLCGEGGPRRAGAAVDRLALSTAAAGAGGADATLAMEGASCSPLAAGVLLHTCGHAAHLACWQEYMSGLLRRVAAQESFEGEGLVRPQRGEFLCPVCRGVANCMLPVAPQDPPHPPDAPPLPEETAHPVPASTDLDLGGGGGGGGDTGDGAVDASRWASWALNEEARLARVTATEGRGDAMRDALRQQLETFTTYCACVQVCTSPVPPLHLPRTPLCLPCTYPALPCATPAPPLRPPCSLSCRSSPSRHPTCACDAHPRRCSHTTPASLICSGSGPRARRAERRRRSSSGCAPCTPRFTIFIDELGEVD